MISRSKLGRQQKRSPRGKGPGRRKGRTTTWEQQRLEENEEGSGEDGWGNCRDRAKVEEQKEGMQDHLKLSNYHLMVRSEVMRGRFRNSFETPEAFVPNEKTAVNIKLQDVFHTFKKGHKVQIQVQSTWFPLIDLNPQTFVPNIYKATKEDFKNQTHTLFNDSSIEFSVLK